MNMKNRFGWRDKQDVTTGGEKLPTPIIDVSKNNSNREDTETEAED